LKIVEVAHNACGVDGVDVDTDNAKIWNTSAVT
jgi:hypothetical protein